MSGMFREDAAPSADEAAMAVLAACLSNQEFAEKACELLSPDDFQEAALGGDTLSAFFAAIQSVVSKGKRAAPVVVDAEVKRLGLAKDVNAAKYLAQIKSYYQPGVSMNEYVNIMREYGDRRRMRMQGLALIDLSANMELTRDQLETEMEAIKHRYTRVDQSDRIRRLGEVIQERIELHRNRKRGEVIGLATGFDDLDDIMMGMQNGDLIILAARPGGGKTALAQNIGENVAKKGRSVGIVEIEMPDEQLADRAIAADGVVDGGLLRSAMVDDRHWESVLKNLQASGIMDAKLWIDDRSKTVPQMRRWALKVKRIHGLDLLIVDYLQLIQVGDRYKGNRVAEVTEVSSLLKGLARELQVPVIALSQLSRKVEERPDKRPMLSDLRETGAIEQDADAVVFIYRDDYYAELEKRAPKAPGEAEVTLAKHRNGPTGTARLGFIATRTKFVTLDKRRA